MSAVPGERKTPGFSYEDFTRVVGSQVPQHIYDRMTSRAKFQALCKRRSKLEATVRMQSDEDVVRALDEAVDAVTEAIHEYTRGYVAAHAEQASEEVNADVE